MANNLIQIKRTSVSGRAANTSTLTNAGELALNMTDGIMYSTNGSVVFEIGANNTTVNISNSINVGANLIVNTTTVFVGNSTLNASVTSSLIQVSNSNFIANLAPNGLSVGNSTANNSLFVGNLRTQNSTRTSIISPGTISLGPNATAVNASLSTTTLSIGNTVTNGSLTQTVLSVANSTISANVTTSGLVVGANMIVNASTVFIGNSTVNSTHNATLVQVSNSTATANLNPISLTIGTSVVNSTVLAAGANVVANTTTVFVGNSTVNSTHNATLVQVSNSTATANLNPISLTIGTSVVNSTVIAAGANVYANVTTVFVGNSTVNASHTATLLQVSNSTATANLNPASLTIGNTVINSTAVAVNNNSRIVFSPLAGGTSVNFIQQNDDNFVFYTSNTLNQSRAVFSIYANSVTSNLNMAVPLNSAGLVLGTSFVSANGSNGTSGQVLTSNGTATYWSTVSGGGGGTVAGSNTQVQFNDSGAFGASAGLVFDKAANNLTVSNTVIVGNSTVNASHSATQLQVSNSTSTANLNPVSLTIGTAVVNTTAVNAPALTVAGISTFNGNVVLGTSGLSSNGSFGTAGQVLSSNGTATYWSAAGNTTITVSNAAPSSPVNNQLWWNSDLGAMFIYYADANTSQWVETNPLGQFGVTAVQTVGITTGKAIAMAIVFGG